MIQQIIINRFKLIDSVIMNLDKINVLVGANNAGKSSVLQALQFATSVAQTAKLYSQNVKFDKNGCWATSIYPDQLIYSPLKDPYSLASGGVLKEDIEKSISVSFVEDTGEMVKTTFRKGRNKNIAARFEGESMGRHLSSLETPFCMYVPGLAGISFEEEIRSVGVIRKIAAKGDCNTVFRNIINLLFADKEKWQLFLTDLRDIFPEIDFSICSNPNIDGSINVQFKLNDNDTFLPIDLAGTGVLQAVQLAAYVNYFKPRLLLLDEPDSHLHPDNQRSLATLLVKLADRTETTIIISTHSRHLMAALQSDAKFFLMRHGKVDSSEYDHYIGLMELGALDEYDHIKNGDFKYIVLTEDSSIRGREYLRILLRASGYTDNEFKIFSYYSVSKIDSAKMFAKFLLNLNPNLTVIIYRDRDGLYDEEIDEIKKQIECDNRIKFVVATGNDIEMYYCNAKHIISVCNESGLDLTEQEALALIAEAVEESEEDSKKKFYSHRTQLARIKKQPDGEAILRAENAFKDEKLKYIYGKKVSGLLKSKLQKKFGKNINIYKMTSSLTEQQFTDIHTVA